MQKILPSERYLKMWKQQQVPLLKYLYLLNEEEQPIRRVLHNQSNVLEMIFVVDGFAKYLVNGKEYVLQKGELLIVNAGQNLDELFYEEQAATRYILGLQNVLIAGLEENCFISEDQVPVFSVQNEFSLLKQMLELFAYLQEESDLHAELLGNQVKSLFLLLSKLVGEQQEKLEDTTQEEMPLALLIKDYLDQHFTEDISLDFLSKRFKISSFYLSHMYKKQFNYSPVQYILRKRISLAQTLLITSDLSIGEVARKVGYKNPSHFHLLFTKNVGVSPRKYRMNYEI